MKSNIFLNLRWRGTSISGIKLGRHELKFTIRTESDNSVKDEKKNFVNSSIIIKNLSLKISSGYLDSKMFFVFDTDGENLVLKGENCINKLHVSYGDMQFRDISIFQNWNIELKNKTYIFPHEIVSVISLKNIDLKKFNLLFDKKCNIQISLFLKQWLKSLIKGDIMNLNLNIRSKGFLPRNFRNHLNASLSGEFSNVVIPFYFRDNLYLKILFLPSDAIADIKRFIPTIHFTKNLTKIISFSRKVKENLNDLYFDKGRVKIEIARKKIYIKECSFYVRRI